MSIDVVVMTPPAPHEWSALRAILRERERG
jgi:hypothetical protein